MNKHGCSMHVIVHVSVETTQKSVKGSKFTINCIVVIVGNCAIIKPSEVSAAAAELLAELIPKYLDQVIPPKIIN